MICKIRIVIVTMLTAAFLCSCSMFPQEKVFDSSYLSANEEVEYQYAYAVRGDLVQTEKVVCAYVPLVSEDYSFSIDDELYSGIYVKNKDIVRKGDLLAELYTEELLILIAKAKVQIEELLIKQKRLEEEQDIAVRRRRLYLEGLDEVDRVTKESADMVNLEYENKIEDVKLQIIVLKNNVEQWTAEVESKRIYALSDGVVTYTKDITSESRSTAGSKIITVTDNSASFFMAQTEFAEYFHEGDQLVVHVDEEECSVIVVEPSAYGIKANNNQVFLMIQTYSLNLSQNDKGILMLIVEQKKNVIYLPEDAITRLDDETVVFYINQDGIRDYKKVTTGFTAGGYIEIIEGISESECVIIG